MPPLARDPLCAGNAHLAFVRARKDAAPRLGDHFSRALRSFVARCLVKTPGFRVTAEQLLSEEELVCRPCDDVKQLLAKVVALARAPDCLDEPQQKEAVQGFDTMSFGQLHDNIS